MFWDLIKLFLSCFWNSSHYKFRCLAGVRCIRYICWLSVKLKSHLLFILSICVASIKLFFISVKYLISPDAINNNAVWHLGSITLHGKHFLISFSLFLIIIFFNSSFPHLPYERFSYWHMDWIKWYKSWTEVPLDRWNRSLLYKLGQRLPIRTCGIILIWWPGK